MATQRVTSKQPKLGILPTSEGGRSSLIRREADALGTATLGTAANGWVLASRHSRLSPDRQRGMVAMKMLEPPVMMLVVRYPLNYHISVLPVIRTLAQR